MATTKPDPLGTSLALDNGDLRLAAGDLARVSGLPNLHRGLSALIETPFGTDLFNVGYGFDFSQVIELPRGLPGGLRLEKELIRLNLVRTLSIDDRVTEVREVVFDDEPRFFELVEGTDPTTARDAHKHRREWRVVVVLALINGDTANLTLTGPGI
ncbi:MAG TPA: hypothetical protein PK413_16580 [Thermoanaerobaculia bacterium]|nr:hypothetical protein [Thermoanaerobaculia bacterium]